MKSLFLQAVKFFGVSGIGWILDFGTYCILGYFSSNLEANNYISSWVGVTFVFIFATRKIFQNNSKVALRWKYLIYVVYQVLLIFLVSKILVWINEELLLHITTNWIGNFSNVIAKILVTPITMILNFFVMKNVIEKI